MIMVRFVDVSDEENTLSVVALQWRKKIVVGIGALGVALGAFGAHSLKAVLEGNGNIDIWKTAVFYHLIHALVLLVITLYPTLYMVCAWCLKSREPFN